MRYKTFMLILHIILFQAHGHTQKYKVKKMFLIHELPAVAEGMTYDPIGKNFYFAETHSKRLLRYSLKGHPAGYIDAAIDGMTSMLGMTVSTSTHQLWVCGALTKEGKKIRCMFQYDLKTGKLIEKYPDVTGEAKGFNDVAITEDGSVYTTDWLTKSLYKVDVGKKATSLYLRSDSLDDGNGISSNGSLLYVSTSYGITRVDTKTKEISIVELKNFMTKGHDGLYFYKNSLIGIQNVFFPVAIIQYVLDSSGRKIEKGIVLAAGHPSFVIPTTGAIVGDYFYFMSNNNLVTHDKDKKMVVSKINLN